MAPRTKEQFEEIREEKRGLILETALRLFSRNGYYHTSISHIAVDAGISKGLVYNYFESKEHLLRCIILEGMDEMFSSFDPDSDGVLTADEFTYFIRTVFQLLRERKDFWRLYFGLMSQPGVLDELGKSVFVKRFEEFFQMLRDHFAGKSMKDPDILAGMFLAFIDGIAFQIIFIPELFPEEEGCRIYENKLIELFK